MENKILIKLIVPELDEQYDIFIPVNELIWKVKQLIVKSISEITDIEFDSSKDFFLINKNGCTQYRNNDIIIKTDIRNGSELILISNSKIL